jgi:hypothetical protein
VGSVPYRVSERATERAIRAQCTVHAREYARLATLDLTLKVDSSDRIEGVHRGAATAREVGSVVLA